MARRKKLMPEQPLPKVDGGRSRSSVRVSLRRWPAIAERQRVNERLLDGTCAFTKTDSSSWSPESLRLLLRITTERFSGEHALLRAQAVRELAGVRTAEGIGRLAALAATPVEDDSVRAAAAGALAASAPEVAAALFAGLEPARGSLLHQTVAKYELSERPTSRKRSRREPARDDRRSPTAAGLPR